MTIIITSIFGFFLAYGWERFCERIIKVKAMIVFGYRLHHSLYGLAFIIIVFVFQTIIPIGLGIGIIIQHTITDGLRFVSEETKSKHKR